MGDGGQLRPDPGASVPRADHIIYIGGPRLRCTWAFLRRALVWRGKQRPDMADGCPDILETPPDLLLAYSTTSNAVQTSATSAGATYVMRSNAGALIPSLFTILLFRWILAMVS